MDHYSIVAKRAEERAIAFGREYHTARCEACKGAGRRIVRHRAFWGLVRWRSVETCPTCHGSRHMPLGDHMGEAEKLVRDIQWLRAKLERQEAIDEVMSRYGVRADDLETAFLRAGRRPQLPIQTGRPSAD